MGNEALYKCKKKRSLMHILSSVLLLFLEIDIPGSMGLANDGLVPWD
jgi:hypothetical protein